MLTLTLFQITYLNYTWGGIDIPFVNCILNVNHLLHPFRRKTLLIYYMNESAFLGFYDNVLIKKREINSLLLYSGPDVHFLPAYAMIPY